MIPLLTPVRKQAGFNMIEVLVTLVILLIGLMGMAGLMLQSQRAEVESYQRVQAIVLLDDMVGRMRANRNAAACYAITTDTTYGTPTLGTGNATTPTCTTAGTAAQQAIAVQDMKDWEKLLLGSNVVGTVNGTASTKTGGIQSARGCIVAESAGPPIVYRVSVAWQGMGKTGSQPSTWTCAKGQYGDTTDSTSDQQRRVVSTVVSFAKLQ
jgi:type IV pilus assembly protein PilV